MRKVAVIMIAVLVVSGLLSVAVSGTGGVIFPPATAISPISPISPSATATYYRRPTPTNVPSTATSTLVPGVIILPTYTPSPMPPKPQLTAKSGTIKTQPVLPGQVER